MGCGASSLSTEANAGASTPAQPAPVGRQHDKKYDCFLTHDWGTDTLGRNNHARVILVNEGLKKKGVKAWLDHERMQGDIVDQMTQGIEDSSVLVVFITENYIKKVAGKGPNGKNDNCKTEFDYAVRRLGVSMILPVVMEPSCHDTRTWCVLFVWLWFWFVCFVAPYFFVMLFLFLFVAPDLSK